jgi:hypothetical protein
MVTVQLPVPEQPPPDHPANTEPESAAAESETEVPEAKLVEQLEPQLMPAGAEVTVPEPVPFFATLSANCEAAT